DIHARMLSRDALRAPPQLPAQLDPLTLLLGHGGWIGEHGPSVPQLGTTGEMRIPPRHAASRCMVSSATGPVADDTLQTQTVDPLEARVVVFRQQPDARGFAELRQELRDAGRGELLADVCATWAPHERDPIRAA